MRSDFSQYIWEYKNRVEIVISTVINENIYKGLDTIFDTMNILNDMKINFCWNVIGIVEKSQLVDLFKHKLDCKNCINKIKFHGIKNSKEIIDILLNSSVFVHPSHIDNSPNSVCEAMQLGLPVISSNVGGVNSIIEDGKSGLLFSDAYKLVSDLFSLKNEEYAKSISKNARESALQRHDSKKVVSDLLNIYTEILKK